jgi:hypothetical protein
VAQVQGHSPTLSTRTTTTRNTCVNNYHDCYIITYLSSVFLLLLGWYRTKRSMHCCHLSCILHPHLVLIISDSSTRVLWQIPAQTHSSVTGETWREMPFNFASKYLYYTPLSFRTKSFHGFLLLFKIQCSRPGLNRRTLGPMASTINTKPPITTNNYRSNM